MSPGKFVLLLLVVGSLGIWGCAQGAGSSANTRGLELPEVDGEADDEDTQGKDDQYNPDDSSDKEPATSQVRVHFTS